MAHRILIVDDDQIFNNLLTDVFRQAGYDVESAHAADEALTMLERHPYDLIVTDQRMPGKLGTEFVRDVVKRYPNLPVVMVSGYLENETIRELIKSGIQGVFIKPLNIFQLLKRCAQLLARNDARMQEAADGAGSTSGGGSIRSFPGHTARSTQFVRRLQEVSDFNTNLLIVGNPGTDFLTICEDLLAMGGESEELIAFDSASTNKATLMDRLQQASTRGIALVTLAITEPEKLDEEQASLIIRLARRQSPFESISLLTRFVFCLKQDLDSLYDEELIDESLYLFMGANEIKAPSLVEVRDDLPIMAQSILERERPGTWRIDADGASWLREQDWPQDAMQLTKVVQTAAFAVGEGIITAEDLEAAYEGRRPDNAGGPTDLRDYLRSARDEYIRAALMLCDSDPDRAATSLGAPRALVDQLAN